MVDFRSHPVGKTIVSGFNRNFSTEVAPCCRVAEQKILGTSRSPPLPWKKKTSSD